MRAAIAVLATAAALALVELWAYAFGTGLEDRFLQPDRVRGWSLRPGFAGWATEENRLWVRINADGMRDRDHARAKPPGTVRVAVLGDSYMQAMSVPLEAAFTSELEQRLDACVQASGRQAEVLNFGVSGYGTAQELLTYTHHAAAYDPDVVLVAVYLGNDLHDNLPSPAGDPRPAFRFDGDGLVLDTSFAAAIDALAHQPWRIRLRQWITDRSRAATLAYHPWQVFRERMAGAGSLETPRDVPWEEDLDALRPPGEDADLEGMWRLTERLLRQLADEARARGAEPWIMTLTVAEQVDPDRHARAAVGARLGVTDLYYGERRLEAFGAAHGIPVVALAPRLADVARANGSYLHGGAGTRLPGGQGHWNAAAHGQAARIAAERLCLGSRAVAAPPAR